MPDNVKSDIELYAQQYEGGLLLDGNEDVAGLVVEALGRVVVSNFLDGTTNNLLVVEDSLGGDFTEDHDHAGLGCGFASNTGGRVLLEASIDDGIGDLVTDFVRVSFSDGFGGEQESFFFFDGR